MNLIRNLAVGSIGVLALTSCNSLYDKLPECPPPGAHIAFTYTQNMDFQDYFAEQVHCLDLYVFKVNEGTKADYSTTLYKTYHNENRMADGTVSVPMDLEPGKYQAVVYGGMNCSESSFAFTSLFNDDDNISIEELEVAMLTNYYFDDSPWTGDYDEDGIDHSALELHDHFYGKSDVFSVGDRDYTPVTIDVMKNTNVINFYIYDKDNYPLEAHDYRMYIIDDNNEMGPDNMLIDGDDIIYRPYIKENKSFIPAKKTSQYAGVQTSFSVSKLSTRRSPRFAIINKAIGEENPIFTDSDLRTKLLDAKDAYPGHENMADQEFLNRENNWDIYVEIDVTKNTWVSITIKVKDWEVRYDNINY